MKLGSAIIFIVIGIWIAYTYPAEAQKVLGFAQQTVDWVQNLVSSI